ncbi:MAG: type II secretion system F family protein [Pedosphaera sp.]|nr:type II secretion system F family protein [Pedosphaera sp.]
MSNYAYEAVNAAGLKCNGVLEVASQSEALRRIKEMGLFPTRVRPRHERRGTMTRARTRPFAEFKSRAARVLLFGGRVKPAVVSVFTRQLATLVDAGMPLLRGLRVLQQQETNPTLKQVIGELGASIEGGSSLSESLAMHPKVFNKLYVNMVKAGEASGALELALVRLAEFQEKAQRIKGKVTSAMVYPVAVMFVAAAIMAIMMVFVVPRFRSVFDGLGGGRPMPAFTVLVLGISDAVRHHALLVTGALFALWMGALLFVRSHWGRLVFDQFKLNLPVIGKVLRAAAISRFARTLGTLLGSGVPVLQAFTIVKETAGNVVVSNLISVVHDNVKEGESITKPLQSSRVFPPMIVGMVDVGEQTGALPDLLLKIANDCDERVDNAVSAMTSLLEPVMIVFLAVVVGSIVVAMFLPIIDFATHGFDSPGRTAADN